MVGGVVGDACAHVGVRAWMCVCVALHVCMCGVEVVGLVLRLLFVTCVCATTHGMSAGAKLLHISHKIWANFV